MKFAKRRSVAGRGLGDGGEDGVRRRVLFAAIATADLPGDHRAAQLLLGEVVGGRISGP